MSVNFKDRARSGVDYYFALDIRNAYKKAKNYLKDNLTDEQLIEVFRQIFSLLQINPREFLTNLKSLSNSNFSLGQFSQGTDSAIEEIGFEIYMNARENNLFVPDFLGEDSFPFFLEHITPQVAYLLLDSALVRSYPH